MPRPRPALDLDNPQHAFAVRLQQLHRRAHKPQQKALAGVLLCSPSRVSDFLTGRAFPDWIYVERFVRHCGGDLDEFHKLWESADEQIEALHRSPSASAPLAPSPTSLPRVAPARPVVDLYQPVMVRSARRGGRLPDPHRSQMVLIGAGNYHSTALASLPQAAANIKGMAQVFTDPQICGIARSNVTLLHDPTSLTDIGRPLTQAADEASDLLLLYYSGHGLVADDGELYLALATTEIDSSLRWSAVPFRLIGEILRGCRARTRVVVLDCCFSGRAAEAMSDPDTVIHGQTDIEGSFTLTSSGRTQVSLAPAGARYTAFTGQLIEILTDGIPGGPEYLSLGEVSRELVRAMRTRSWPSPQTHGTNNAHELDLVRNRAW